MIAQIIIIIIIIIMIMYTWYSAKFRKQYTILKRWTVKQVKRWGAWLEAMYKTWGMESPSKACRERMTLRRITVSKVHMQFKQMTI